MLPNVRHFIRACFLVLFAVYAVTPVQMYAVSGGRSSGLLHPCNHTSTDVIWINLLFSSCFDENEASPAEAQVAAAADQDSDVVLVKKRRAVIREQFNGKPLLDSSIAPDGALDQPSARFPEYGLTGEPSPREVDGCLTLTSGLSPPLLIS